MFYLTDYFFSYGISSNDFLYRHKVNKSKILSFLNSFDSERLKVLSEINYKNEDQYFLFVGRISFEKNELETWFHLVVERLDTRNEAGASAREYRKKGIDGAWWLYKVDNNVDDSSKRLN